MVVRRKRSKTVWENESEIESEPIELDTEDIFGVESGNNQSHGYPTYNFRNTQYKK